MTWMVNGERIDYQEVQREADRLRPQYEATFADMEAESREAQLMDWSKENVIERILINQDAQQDGGEVPSEEIEATFAKIKEQYEDEQAMYKDFGVENEAAIKEELERHLRVEKRLNKVCEEVGDPSEQSIKSYYDRHKQDFEIDEQVRVAHIVKYVNWQSDEESALQSISEAHKELSGGTPFEVVVDKYTDCADSGGDLGYVSRGQMVEEFEDVVFNLGEGQTSDVFRSRFGFHIAKVYDRRPATIAPLKEVRSHIVEKLRARKREEAINAFIDSLKSRAEIKEV